MNETDKKTIITIILKYLPVAKIYLFGSRARQDFSPESDIDIAIDAGSNIDHYTLCLIRDELEESDIPFMIDVVDMHNIGHDLKNDILKEGVQWH